VAAPTALSVTSWTKVSRTTASAREPRALRRSICIGGRGQGPNRLALMMVFESGACPMVGARSGNTPWVAYDRGGAREFFLSLSSSERKRAERLATSGRRLNDPDDVRLTKSFLYWSLANGARKSAWLDPLIGILVAVSLIVESILTRHFILTAVFAAVIPIALWSDRRRNARRRRYLRTAAANGWRFARGVRRVG
jgi:hypothetical protein